MSTIVPQARLRAEADALAELAGSVGFRLGSPDAEWRRRRRDHLVGILRRYLEPRLAEPGHPVVVAVFGPTGSGKSTIVNTLVGRPISETGVLRPTTRRAVVWAHHRHSGRLEQQLGQTGPVEVVGDEHPVLAALAVIDTPDVDSIATEHRRQTTAILETADVAIAVTTPQRYADAVPWDIIGDLGERSLEVVVVMNRAGKRTDGAVIDLAGLLRDARVRGVRSADDVLVVQEQRVRGDGRLHGYSLRHLARRLQSIAADHAGVASRGVVNAVRHALDVTEELASEVRRQAEEAADLLAVADDAEAAQRADLVGRLESGDLVRSEVVARWQRMIGVSDLTSLVLRGIRRVGIGPTIAEVPEVDREIRVELVDLALRRARRATTSIELGWGLTPAGEALIADTVVDWAAIEDALVESIAAWQAEVVDLVAGTGRARFRLARVATFGINASATLVLLGVFASTGGLTGAEMGLAAGAAATQQVVLERLFDASTARRLTTEAREALSRRMEEAVVAAVDRYRSTVHATADPLGLAEELESAATTLGAALEAYVDG